MPSTTSKLKGQPSRWPSNVTYTVHPCYHSSVTPDIRKHIQGEAPERSDSNLASSRPLVLIKQISDSAHPACGQYGLFTAKKIPARTRILYYLGEIHTDDRPLSDYDLSLYRTNDGVSVGIDASFVGNEARFINDYRGIQDKPNATFEEDRSAGTELRMSVWSGTSPLPKGEEILVSYGKSWWRQRLSEYQ